jgi:hypothetical protein
MAKKPVMGNKKADEDFFEAASVTEVAHIFDQPVKEATSGFAGQKFLPPRAAVAGSWLVHDHSFANGAKTAGLSAIGKITGPPFVYR